MTAPSTRSMPPPPAGQPASAQSAGSGITLAVIVSCYLMVGLDSTIVNTALPKIQQELGFTPDGLSWVLNAYMLTFGGFLLLGGRSGDILGRRRVFIAGVAVFTIASLLGGLAMASWWLIAARVLQGIGAAIAAPSTLALIVANFPAGSPRNRALSIYSAVAGAGGSVGLILGGVLTELVSWRWVLFINVPVGVGIIICAPFFVGETPPRTGGFDVLGAATSTLSMTSLVFAFVQAPASGWTSVTTLVAFLTGIALMIAFLLVEHRADHPVTPLSLFRDRRRSGALLNMLLLSAAMFGAFFFLIQFLQDVRGFRPATAGIAFLPVTVTMFTTARCAPMLMRRFGLRAVMVTGTALIVAADVLFSRVSPGTGYLTGIFVPMLLLGLGVGSNFMPLNMTILESVDSSEAGAASGLAQTMQWVGGSLGLGILVSVFGLTSGNAGGHGTPELLARGMSGIFTASAVFAGCAMVVALFLITARASRRPG